MFYTLFFPLSSMHANWGGEYTLINLKSLSWIAPPLFSGIGGKGKKGQNKPLSPYVFVYHGHRNPIKS